MPNITTRYVVSPILNKQEKNKNTQTDNAPASQQFSDLASINLIVNNGHHRVQQQYTWDLSDVMSYRSCSYCGWGGGGGNAGGSGVGTLTSVQQKLPFEYFHTSRAAVTLHCYLCDPIFQQIYLLLVETSAGLWPLYCLFKDTKCVYQNRAHIFGLRSTRRRELLNYSAWPRYLKRNGPSRPGHKPPYGNNCICFLATNKTTS
jgi:hypothetical protein